MTRTQPASDEHWRRLRADVGKLVSRRLSNPADVEDVIQEVLVRVWRHGPELRDQERFGAWLMRLVFTAAADHFRKRATLREVSGEAPGGAEGAGPSSEGWTDDSGEPLEATLADILRPFVNELPPRHRDVIVLSELQGLSHAAIADRLSLSLTAVKSRVQRGRKQLRAALEACCRFAVDARGAPIECVMRSDAAVPKGFCAADQAAAGCHRSCTPSRKSDRS